MKLGLLRSDPKTEINKKEKRRVKLHARPAVEGSGLPTNVRRATSRAYAVCNSLESYPMNIAHTRGAADASSLHWFLRTARFSTEETSVCNAL